MLLNELLEQFLYGDPSSLDMLAGNAGNQARALALKVARRRLESRGYADQSERKALQAAALALSSETEINMAPMIIGGESSATKYVLVVGGLLAAGFLLYQKK